MNATIEVKNIKKTFILSQKQMKLEKATSNKKIAVDGISFETYSGEIFGLLGPNGAGKTTTLRCIATLIKPDNGEIFVKGINNKDEITTKRNLAFLTNELRLEDQMTPNYAFFYYARFHGLSDEEINKRKNGLFTRFGIDKFAEVKIGDLSTGMKQKVSIAVSLVNDPDIIVFDEPTNGLDILTARQVTDYLIELKNQGKTVIISTHIMGLVEKLCDRVGIIIDGKMLVCDTLTNIYSKYPNKSLEDIFFDLYQMKVGEFNA